MAFFMDGFDYYTALASNGWGVAASAGGAFGSGAYAYGRYARIDAFTGTLTRTLSTVVGVGSGANWPTIYAGMYLGLGSYTNARILFYETATVQCSISWTAGGLMVFSRGDRTTTLGTGAIAMGAGWFSFKLVLSNTVGTFKCYVNGVLDLNLTGLDNCSTANEYATSIAHIGGSGNMDLDNYHLYNGQDAAPWNDIMAERRIRFQLPTGNGAAQDWAASAGNAWACIDENPPNGDTDYIATAAAGNKSTFTYPAYPNVASVDAVNVILTAKKDDAGVRSIKAVVRDTGGTLAYGPVQTMTAAYLAGQSTFLVDPITAGAWSLTNVNAYQYGVQVEA